MQANEFETNNAGESVIEQGDESYHNSADNFEIGETILKLKTDLIKKDENRRVQSKIIDDSNLNFKLVDCESAGSNGIFEALPKVVKFAGFELNKKQTMKLQIVNKSKFSQRCNIIPPTTPFFNIKFTKKGNIPAGLCETIVITFNPQAYQYD
jgi:hypothetical protein